MASGIKLSVLILSLTERHRKMLPRVLDNLENQARNFPVEILVLTDNMKREIGTKRNLLMNMAQGEYVCFVDDDDKIADNYLETILKALQSGPDCVVFDAWVTLNGKNGKVCKYGKEFSYRNGRNAYFRHPNHLMVHKKANVKDQPFREISFGEDDEWAARVVPTIKTQERIDHILYYYEYSRATSRSRK